MAVDTDQLVLHFGQVQKTLMTCPKINIVEIQGQPPDKYEIEYQVTGYIRKEDGSVETADTHRVLIDLPFGYPHFPPVAKPLTPIFHPDIDPDAIRIADFWQSDPSLSKLIIHIGEMICGKQYSLEDPFNQEAADWFRQHEQDLPLDEITFTKQPEILDEAISETIQTLDNSLDQLSLEGKEDGQDEAEERLEIEEEATVSSAGEEVAPEKEERDERLKELNQAIEEKRFFAASHLLSQILETTFIPECKELEQTINTAIRETDRLFKSAEQLESQGDLDQALMQVETLISITSDFPGIEDVRRRIQQALAISGSMQNRGNSLRKGKFSQQAPVERKKRHKEESLRKGRPLSVKFVVLFVLLVLGAAVGIKIVSERQELSAAAAYIKQASDLVEQKRFKQAQTVLEKALSAVSSVQLLVPQKKQLVGKIATIREDRDFTEGIQGKTLYKGEYVSLESVPLRKQLDQMLSSAEELQKSGKNAQAMVAYEEAISYAAKHQLPLPEGQIDRVRSKLEIQVAVQEAGEAEKRKDWGKASEAYHHALLLAADNEELAADLEKRLSRVAFQQKFEAAGQAFAHSDWQLARNLIVELLNLLKEKKVLVSAEQQEEIEHLYFQTVLKQQLENAKKYYENGKLSESVKAYEKALVLLHEGKGKFSDVTAESIRKLDKTLLMVRIAREQNEAAVAEEEGDLQGAIKHYQTILELIAQGNFQEEEALQTLAKNTRLQIIARTNQLVLESKISWLLENYETLFQENYPSVKGSELSNPQARFLKKDNGKLIFSISCREQGQGTPSRLELEYQFDPETGVWSLYSGQ